MDSSLLEARQASGTMHKHAPYPATTAGLGGLPTVGVDVPICAVFLALFLTGAISHITIFQINRKHGHKFIISAMLGGFCMARVVTQIMRIVWACKPKNVSIALASNIFVAAGVIIPFIVNLLFAQRIIRAAHPNFGWHRAVHYFFQSIYVLIVFNLVMLITCVVQSSYTLNHNTKRIDRDIQLYGQTYYALIALLPIPIVLIGLAFPRKSRLEKFGSGRWRHKIGILIISSFLLALGAFYRIGVNYAGGTRPVNDPAPYQSKACFYIFNFVVEIIVILAYVVLRVDTRFYVPNGSHGPGDYARKEGKGNLGSAILPEEEVFDDMSAGDLAVADGSTKRNSSADEEKGDVRKELGLKVQKDSTRQNSSADAKDSDAPK